MPIRHSILKVLAYFDLFDYPVTQEEIGFFLDKEVSVTDLTNELIELTRAGLLFQNGILYALRNDPQLAVRRTRGALHADHLLKIAARISRRLYRFPYVRGVGISGSLSKGFADEEADIDYFIITRRNRLWIARTLLHFYKKLNYLRHREHYYCMNYFVDEDALEIKEKNIFTATEMVTLIPASGKEGLTGFFQANNWTAHYFPQYRSSQKAAEAPAPTTFLKPVIEWLFNGRLGDRLDDLLHRWTDSRWRKKEQRGDLNIKGQRMSIQNTKHFSRPNPANFQQRVLDRYAAWFRELEAKWGLTEKAATHAGH